MAAPFARSLTPQTARKASALWVATKTGARGVALLGIVVSATTFVARLAIILFLSATWLMVDSIGGSLACQSCFPRLWVKVNLTRPNVQMSLSRKFNTLVSAMAMRLAIW